MLKIFIGYDHRQPVSYNVLQYSILKNASVPVSITPIVLPQVNKVCGFRRHGLTPFTYSRFLVPYLCNYEGWALFLDIDILLLDDIKKLFDLANDKYTVMVSKNEHKFEWASVMLFNNAKCKHLTPDFISDENNKGLHQIRWADDAQIGDLPREWNHLVGYDNPRNDAKLVHYTQGVPAYDETESCEFSSNWHDYIDEMNSTAPWFNLMGQSVHAKTVEGFRVPNFLQGEALNHLIEQKKDALAKSSEFNSESEIAEC